MKSYEEGLEALRDALANTKLEWLSTELKRANLDYARGIAFMLDIRIDYAKMEVIEK
jgi:hypothetical protein